jgi:acetylornithine/N-succinyldiaminopimelate aminotransferase
MTAAGDAFVMPTYARYPLAIVRGEGMRVFDDRDRAYLDFAGALGAMPLGHGHQRWRRAVHAQIDELVLTSNLYFTRPQARLAELLASILPIPDARVFFCNSGAEANEAAIKLARRWGLERGRTTIVALEGSFHGRTAAALSATGQPSKRAAFEPMLDWFVHVPRNDLGAMEAAVDADTAAVLLEPVLGEGGVRPLDDDYLRAVRALTLDRGCLLVADEVQSGMGRCGEWIAASLAGIVPDVVCLAKGLGGGLPIGATVASADLAFRPGEHASTFGGNPVACAAGVAVIETISDEQLLENAREQGERLREKLRYFADASEMVEGIRGRGLLIGLQLARPLAHELALALLAEGVLVTEAGPDVLRLSPPLIVSPEDVDGATGALASVLDSLSAAGAPA